MVEDREMLTGWRTNGGSELMSWKVQWRRKVWRARVAGMAPWRGNPRMVAAKVNKAKLIKQNRIN
jgi:hypothetical protein